MDVDAIFADMGAFWSSFRKYFVRLREETLLIMDRVVVADPQHRWLGPEKGVIHLATAAVSNAIWDMMAKSRGKPLWKLICDFTPDEYVFCL